MGSSEEEPKSYQYKYWIDFAVLLCENPISKIIKIFENKKLIYNNGAVGNKRWESMTLFNGTQTAPSSIIQAKEGAAYTPAFLNHSYVVFGEYALENAGNSIPNMEFIIEEKSQTSLSQAIQQLMERGGYDTTQFSIDVQLASIQMLGYITTGPTSTRAAILDLLRVFEVISYEYNAVIYFKKKSTIPEYEIDYKFLSAKEGDDGDDAEENSLTIVNLDQRDFPREIVLTYPDTTLDLQTGSQTELKQNNASKYIDKTLTEDVLVTMSPTSARNRVNTMLWQKWNENKTVTFKLAPSQFLTQETDIIKIVDHEQTYIIRVESITCGANFISEVSGTVVGLTEGSMEAPYLTQNIPSADAVYTEQELYEIPDLDAFLVDCGPLRPGDENSTMLYSGQSMETGNEFLGATIYKALTASSVYNANRATTVQSTSGIITSSLSDFTGVGWDMYHTVQVYLNFGSLVSRSQDEILEGYNYCVIGDEVLAFTNATLVAPNTYEIQMLIRGRRGTEVTNHTSGERFLLLYQSEIETMPMTTADYEIERFFKWVPSGSDLADVSPKVVEYNARTVREFAPVRFEAERHVPNENDWTFNWLAVTRSLWAPLGNTTKPKPDGRHYSLNIYSGGSILRTIDITDAETAVWTAEQQFSDVGFYAGSFTAGIVQHNDTLGILGIETKETF